MMDLKVHLVVHVHEKDRINDKYLLCGSIDYGIFPKEIIKPLRVVNGKTITIPNGKIFQVDKLWNYLEESIYSIYDKSAYDYIRENSDILEKYFIFNGTRYSVDKTTNTVLYYLALVQSSDDDYLQIQILVSADAGTWCQKDGIKYYFYSNESTRHNEPHVHVSVKHERNGVYSLKDNRRLSGNLNSRDEKKVKKVLTENKVELLNYWNKHTNGLTVDLNQVLKTIEY